jgi:hypothetical protein
MPFAVPLILHNRFEIMHAHAQIMQQNVELSTKVLPRQRSDEPKIMHRMAVCAAKRL